MRFWLAGLSRFASRSFVCFSGNVGETAADVAPSWAGPQCLTGWFMLLGLLSRAIRYYLCFPLWADESFLCVNFINRSYAELLQPLDYHQVAPILFLWIERLAAQLLGFSEYSLRLFPFVCSMASVFLFRRMAEQLLSGPALLLAIGIFAVSYPGVRYAAEAKPYGSDLFISMAMLCLVVEWLQRRAMKTKGSDGARYPACDNRWLWCLTVLMPLAVGLSYPAVFMAGGLSLVVGWTLWQERGSRTEWQAWLAWNFTLVASFAFWFWLAGRVQNGAEGEFMGQYWKANFPPIREPWKVPLWLLKTHASDFLAYPVGGPNWASTVTLVFCLAGFWRLVQEGKGLCLGLLLGPVSLHFLAAALERYPYGGHVKFSQYLAPMICCLTAVGVVQVLDWWSRRGHSVQRGVAWYCAVLVAIGVGLITRDMVCPYKTRSEFRARAFAQAFWFGVHHAEEVLCLKSDLGLDFVPDQHRELSSSAHYRCNRAIEVSRFHLLPANLSRVSRERPLRCVLYRDARFEFDQAAMNRWLADMQQHYVLIGRTSLPFPQFAKNERRLMMMEYIDSYQFIPRDRSSSGSRPPPLADRRTTCVGL